MTLAMAIASLGNAAPYLHPPISPPVGLELRADMELIIFLPWRGRFRV